jgi:hypothetical protein
MQVIFDPPVVAHGLSGTLGAEGSRGDTVSGLAVGFGVAFDAGLDTDDAGDIGQAKFTGEAALAGQPIDLTQDTCGALFDAAVVVVADGVGVGRLICGTSAFELEGDTLSAELSCQSQTISIVADVAFEGRVALLWSGHIHGDGANTLGGAALLSLTRWAMEFLDVDELRIAGATRTSGANPGHTPRLLVFRHD